MSNLSFNLSIDVVQIRTVSNTLLIGFVVTPVPLSKCSASDMKALAEHFSNLGFNEYLHCFHLCEVNLASEHVEFAPWLPLSSTQFNLMSRATCMSVSVVDKVYAKQFETYLESNGVVIKNEIIEHMKHLNIHLPADATPPNLEADTAPTLH